MLWRYWRKYRSENGNGVRLEYLTIFFERTGLVLDIEYFCVVHKSGSFIDKPIIQSKVCDTFP